MDEVVDVGAEGIRLGQLLKLVGIAETGGAVKQLLDDGVVLVDGAVETRRGAQLAAGSIVTVGDTTLTLR